MIDTALLKETAPDLLGLAEALTTLRKSSSSNGGEFSGACPFCGMATHDGFSVQPYATEPRWLCRKCTDGKWQDVINFVERRDNVDFKDACKTLFGGDVKIAIDPAEYERIQQVREETIQERLERERQAQQSVRDRLHEERHWEPFYQLLQSNPAGRQLWHERGLSDDWIDYYKVGYCPSREFYSHHKFTAPTLTIPTWNAERCVGLTHRILLDDPPGGKYRPHLAGAGKPLFMADPMVNMITGSVLLLEGEIKTMVTWANIWKDQPLEGHPLYNLEVVGIAGKGFKHEWVSEFEQADNIYILLDPDAHEAAQKVAVKLGVERCKVVTLPEKIDDLFLWDALSMNSLWKLLNA